MKLIVNEDRTTVSLGTWGTENENNYEVLNFEIPEKFNDYNKRIVYYLDDERKWDLISNNRILIPNSVTKYERVKAYIWMTKSEEITLKYACDGTETGNYYFTYDNTNYYFTMPEVEENDELIFDVSTSKLKLNNVEIQTSSTGTGTELEFITLINAEEDFRTKLFEMDFYENENADGIIPTQEEVDGFNSMITLMNNKITEVDEVLDGKVDEVDDKIAEGDAKIQEIDQEITGVENLDIDVSDKVDGDVTITLTKKDASTKTVVLSDGTSLEFNWNGTSLGIKTDDDSEYTYVNLQGVQGPKGDTGEAFTIKKTYPSVEAMNADFNNMQVGDYVMIASSVEVQDNAKLYTKGEQAWIFISDFSGAQGIKGETGETPNIQIGTVQSGAEFNVTRSGTNENPVLNFTLVPGEKGDKGDKGNTGSTGNGISSISKTGTSGLVDTYTITFTNSNTTNFTVTNGRGISSIAKTSTSGLVDTYTITYNDGTTSTFEVTNGEDGEVTQAQLDELKSHVDDLETLIETELDSNEVEGTEIDVSDSAEYPGKIIPGANLEQEQLSGNQLMDFSSARTDKSKTQLSFNNDTLTVTGSESTYNFAIFGITTQYKSNPGKVLKFVYDSIDINSQYGNVAQLRIVYNDGTPTAYSGLLKHNLQNILQNIPDNVDNVDNVRIEIYSNNTSTSQNSSVTITKPMLQFGTEEKDYEPYCGGQPSPNPDYPQEIKVVTGDNVVKHVGKNLFNKSSTVEGVLTEDGTISSGSQYVTSDYIKIDSQKTYTKTATNSARVKFYDANKNVISNASYSDISNFGTPLTFAIPYANAKYIRYSINKSILDTQQLEEGTTPTPYEPYREEEYELSLGTMELCKIGDYEDILFKNVVGDENYNAELESGAWYKKNAIDMISGSSDLTSNGIDDNRVGFLTPVLNIEANLGDLRQKCFCNLLQTLKNNYSGLSGTTSSSKIRIDVSKEYVSTYGEAKQLLEDIKIYFVQLNPTYTKITNTTLIQQLEALRKAKWFKGVNHWWTETENLEPVLKGTYKQSNILRIEALEQAIENLQNI